MDLNNTARQHTVYLEKLSEHAILPTRATQCSAGLDLYSPVTVKIFPGYSLLLKLDFKIQMPIGTFGKIEERSGMALLNNLIVKGGVIDQDYSGNVGVILYNHGLTSYEIKRGDRVAQLIIQPLLWPVGVIEMRQVTVPESTVQLMPSPVNQRGDNGFGSSGRAMGKTFHLSQGNLIAVIKPLPYLPTIKCQIIPIKCNVKSEGRCVLGAREVKLIIAAGSYIIQPGAQARVFRSNELSTQIQIIGALVNLSFPGSLHFMVQNVCQDITSKYILESFSSIADLYFEAESDAITDKVMSME